MQKEIRAVLFDLFQTLIPVAPGISIRKIFLESSGLDDGCDVDWGRLYNLVSNGRHPGAEGAVRELCDSMGIKPDDEMLAKLVEQRLQRHLFGFRHIDSDVPRLIRAIKTRGVKTALLSNSDSQTISLFSGSSLDGLFDEAVFSHEVGLTKPDPGIFTLTAQRLGISPPHCLFVADGANGEFDGARACGMQTALVMGYADPERREEWGRVCDLVFENIFELPEYLGVPWV